MAYSKILIWNMALAHIGVSSTIESETENSREAEVCRLFYDHCINVLLQAQPWAFANRQASLTSLGDERDSFGYRYKYPNDCARANFIVNPSCRTPAQGQKIPFQVVDLETSVGKAILTDQEDAVLDYNYRVSNESLFSPAFVQALSLFLAAHIGMPLRANADIIGKTQQLFTVWNSEAAATNFAEAQEDTERNSIFVSGRA